MGSELKRKPVSRENPSDPVHDAPSYIVADQFRDTPGDVWSQNVLELSRDHCFFATILQFKSAILAFSASVQACPPF